MSVVYQLLFWAELFYLACIISTKNKTCKKPEPNLSLLSDTLHDRTIQTEFSPTGLGKLWKETFVCDDRWNHRHTKLWPLSVQVEVDPETQPNTQLRCVQLPSWAIASVLSHSQINVTPQQGISVSETVDGKEDQMFRGLAAELSVEYLAV